MLFGGLFRRRDRDEFHLRELMLADHAARVAARRAGLSAKARCSSRHPYGQLVFVGDVLAHEIGQRDFGRRDEPVSLARWKLILLELRKLCRAEHGVVPDEQRRVHFRIAVLGRVQVEHELGERPLEPRQRTLQHHEACAGQLGRRLEIHETESLADLEMLLGREVEAEDFADPAEFHIGALVRSHRHVLRRHVGDARQEIAQRLVLFALVLLALLDRVLDPGHFVHQALSFGFVLGLLGLPDFLRRGIAARLQVLQLLNRFAALRIEREDLIQQLGGRGFEAALLETGDEGIRVLAYPFDVKHRWNSLSGRRLPESAVPV